MDLLGSCARAERKENPPRKCVLDRDHCRPLLSGARQHELHVIRERGGAAPTIRTITFQLR
jgi:hypothetical protein